MLLFILSLIFINNNNILLLLFFIKIINVNIINIINNIININNNIIDWNLMWFDLVFFLIWMWHEIQNIYKLIINYLNKKKLYSWTVTWINGKTLTSYEQLPNFSRLIMHWTWWQSQIWESHTCDNIQLKNIRDLRTKSKGLATDSSVRESASNTQIQIISPRERCESTF